MGCCGAVSAEAAAAKAVAAAGGSVSGRVAIVTGANSGIGKHTALVLARYGVNVIMVGRSMERMQDAAQDVRSEIAKQNMNANLLAGNVSAMECDLSSLSSVRTFARMFIALNSPLHLLICNAGVMMCPYTLSTDGYELQFATNHLGHFYLIELLLPCLRASAPSRIICVSSTAAGMYGSGFDVNQLSVPEDRYSRTAAYGNSKVCNIYCAMELAQRLQGSQVSAFSLHPGAIPTELGKNFCLAQCYYSMFFCCMKSISQGTSTTIYTALQPGLERESGQYFSDCAVKDISYTNPNRMHIAKQLAENSRRMIEAKGFTFTL
eukprot:gnl/Spiro4/15027_TR8097_c0_g1_i1.p1 gnl/Spiro4/15027_TR8097_c0_g1~~gnl/Spiro4/15027_TR8097_c0_g1_i1.p1  ORF type:complete len:335 (+),score=49.28 gnl/Spiro4/15027_TR8097_c0_g1_i1:43-1005(+)